MKEVTYKWTSESQDWESWNSFLKENPRGIYLQTKEWLESYQAYGFSTLLLIASDSAGNILGGVGAVLASAGPFKILVGPYSPIIKIGEELIFVRLIQEFLQKAKSSGAFLAQLSYPCTTGNDNFPDYFLPKSLISTNLTGEKSGLIFKFVTGVSGLRAVRLFQGELDSLSKVVSGYNTLTKRNIKKASQLGNALVFAKSVEEIKTAYNLIILNSNTQGYAVRSWEDFGDTLIKMVGKEQCFIACCENEGQLKGALVVFDIGKKLHYIMGATLREETDFKVGHFLHHQVIQIGVQKGYEFYDISMGGSEGVVRFKEGFGGEIIGIVEPRFWVLKPWQFLAFQKLLPWVQKNKKLVSQILSKLK